MISDTATVHNKQQTELSFLPLDDQFKCEMPFFVNGVNGIIPYVDWLVCLESKVRPYPKSHVYSQMGENWCDYFFYGPLLGLFFLLSLFLPRLLFCHFRLEVARPVVCQKKIRHGVSKCNTGKSVAECTEKPALPPAGPRQHTEGAARRDPQITAAVHRWEGPQVGLHAAAEDRHI